MSVAVLEKGAEVGAHILSGAILEPSALSELIPDWRERGAPVHTLVQGERLLFLSRNKALTWPHWLVPKAMKNHGNYVISLGALCRWLGTEAEALGVEVLPGFAAADLLTDSNGAVSGIATGGFGVGRDGVLGPNYQPGADLGAKFTLLAEGCRGSLTRLATERFELARTSQPQTYGIGFKEIWRVGGNGHRPGQVVHTAGWPLTGSTYGGGFLYSLDDSQLAVGFVVGLDYKNPYLDPFQEFQRFKTHPAIRPRLEGGERLSFGARTLVEGGAQALPDLTFPGGALIGDAAGFLNVAKIKGIHNAIRSGALAAETIFHSLRDGAPTGAEPVDYGRAFAQSSIAKELRRARNFRPSMRAGLVWGGILAGIDQLVFRGGVPWTLRLGAGDHIRLGKAQAHDPIEYPEPDGRVTFDRMSSVYLSGTNHAEDQPDHLHLTDSEIPVQKNLPDYAGPEARICPAAVYEFVKADGAVATLRINAQNCLHCKACEIKDPSQNIRWVTPEGGGGPNYTNM